MTGGHCEQVAHAHGFEIGRRFLWSFLGEVLEYWIIDGQLAICDRQADSCGGKALAERPQDVRLVGRFRCPPCFRYDFAVA